MHKTAGGVVARFALVASAAATVCSTVALPVAAASEAAAPALTWSDCNDGFQCSTVSVPLDYDNPFGTRIDLAVIKLPAADSAKRIGTLFVNFGGPGASGLQRLRERAKWPWLFSDELRSRFDLVSWDPRGIANSAAVRCFDTLAEQQEFFSSFPQMPVDPAGEAPFYEKSKELAYLCEQKAGPILKHASTANTARDLDMLRRAAGEEKINYHGISYGTHLGAIYANLFPNRIRAMVFDGSMDFVGNAVGRGDSGFKVPLDTRQDVSRGVAETHEQFLKLCAESGPKCAFSGGDLKAKYAAIAERAMRGPITIEGDEGPETWTWSGISNMAWDYASVSAWPDLAKLYQRLYDARDTTVSRTAAVRKGEPYTSNRSEAFNAIQCSDSNFPTDTAIYSKYAVSEDQRIPYFGRLSVFDMMSCAFWQAKDTDRYTGPWNRRTSAEILVLNNRYDPSTPLHGAIDGANELARARVFVTEGYGHSTMLAPSTCTEQVKRDYLISGKFPEAGKVCKLDANPFG
ncbi:alpha/beta hydrolase fold [Kibdelosporangium aridum]|uniref:Alpha/beta hydrolase fold n=1 Tax=Kibdelosporangium aridum TaxID=2030 RepID=A0A1W2FXI5_KIBAR|nr:alpha/beta hydrolase fold [Kibdelosporangium aridum]